MKEWESPKIYSMSISMTKERPEYKCTNNNGNGLNCVRNPEQEGTYVGDMFLCKYYVKQGHLCNAINQAS